MHFQSIRQVLHYAATVGDLDLLKKMHKTYYLGSVEPTPEWVMNKVIMDASPAVQQFFAENVTYDEMPWSEQGDNLMRTIGRAMRTKVEEKANTPFAKVIFKRYYIDNFKW